MFCEKCGNQIEEGNSFCSVCGSPVSHSASESNEANSQTNQQASSYKAYSQDPYRVLKRPVLERGLAAIIGYLSWLGFLIAMIGGDRKESYERFHFNQSLGMMIAFTAGLILCHIGVNLNYPYAMYYGGYHMTGEAVAGLILILIGLFLLIFTFVCWLIALIRACRGSVKPVAVFGYIHLLR